MTNTWVIPGRECKVTVCSSENQEAARGLDCALRSSQRGGFRRTLHATVRLTLCVRSLPAYVENRCRLSLMESTANGVGNFSIVNGCAPTLRVREDKISFFVPFGTRLRSTAVRSLIPMRCDSMDDYERSLWTVHGCTLEAIKWHHEKRMAFSDHRSMMAEYPTTPAEAFFVDCKQRVQFGRCRGIARGAVKAERRGRGCLISRHSAVCCVEVCPFGRRKV